MPRVSIVLGFFVVGVGIVIVIGIVGGGIGIVVGGPTPTLSAAGNAAEAVWVCGVRVGM